MSNYPPLTLLASLTPDFVVLGPNTCTMLWVNGINAWTNQTKWCYSLATCS